MSLLLNKNLNIDFKKNKQKEFLLLIDKPIL